MLSDTSIPSMLGYFGAMLYNPNNVTPEAAPVTTEWEIEASNEILEMLGFKPSPSPPSKKAEISEWIDYQKELQNEFGWAHITSGGTIANIEALWVARSVKYAPLAIQEVCIIKKLEIDVKLANGETKDIKSIDKFTLVNIKPNESIYLLSKFIKSYFEKYPQTDFNETSKEALKELNKASYSLSNNLGKLLTEFPLAIFVSGTAHYSIKKAADILGIGRNNIQIIEIDSHFRANVSNLELKIENCINNKVSPLAVIGVAGTTEEGAIDPIDKIVDLRSKIEKKLNTSFWMHVDAAWGGFGKTILKMDSEEEFEIIESKIITYLKDLHNQKSINNVSNYVEFCKQFIENSISIKNDSITKLLERNQLLKQMFNDSELLEYYSKLKKKRYELKNKIDSESNQEEISEIEKKIEEIKPIAIQIEEIEKSNNNFANLNDNFKSFETQKNSKKYDCALRELERLINENEQALFQNKSLPKNQIKINLIDRINELALYSNDKMTIEYKGYEKEKHINIGNGREIVSSYLAFKYADSITTDPHKLGYIPYPNGIIAFKNDRIRHFITQDAPYITSSNHNALLHNPPLHVKEIDFNHLTNSNLPYENYKIAIDAFAPFILEGSKPGAAAASLWLSNKCIPLNRKAHGSIIKNTLLATRELYEWLISWEKIINFVGEDISYNFLPVSPIYPDLNVIVFTIKVKNISTIACMNKFASLVYERYSIQAELGDKNHSYSQPFFLSKTTFTNPNYSYNAFEDFFKKNNIRNSKKDYDKHGVLVLRATLMNPYIYPYKKERNLNLIREFIIGLHKISEEVSAEIITKHNRQQCV